MSKISNEEYLKIIENYKRENKIDYEKGKIRKVFTEILPKGGKRGVSYNQINWELSKKYKVYFIYQDIEGEIEIIDYDIKNNTLFTRYDNHIIDIKSDVFKYGKIGRLLMKITSDFKIKIRTRFQDDKRDIIITDRKYVQEENVDKLGRKSVENRKYYRYKCYKCGFDGGKHWNIRYKEYKDELWASENDILNGGCSCCGGGNAIVVENINSIYHTNPWMIPYIGEEIAKTHTPNSGDYCHPICPNCGKDKTNKMRISSIYLSHSMNCSCSDSVPYTEKFLFSVFKQLKINFEYHKTFEWSKNIQSDNPNLCGRKEYDFYLNDYNIVAETHGNQHYKQSTRGRNLELEQENDKIKRELALLNRIKKEKYIEIDCRYSEFNWIKNSIINSNLNNMFDLSKIDWSKCEEFALSNRVKEACELWNNGIRNTREIGVIMKLHSKTISDYLKKGSRSLNWCNYNPKEVIETNCAKEIICVELGSIFKSISDCERNSIKLFEVKLNGDYIIEVCKGRRNEYKGYHFKYVSDLTEEQIKEIQENAKVNQAI